MKKQYVLFLIALLISATTFSQTTIYSENFTGQNGVGYAYPGPATGLGTVTWNIDLNGALPDFFNVTGEAFISQYDFGSPRWLSPVINIAGYTNVSFSLAAFTNNNMENSDTFLTQYRINGGTWTTAATNGSLNNDFNLTVSQTGLTGNTLEIRVTTTNNASNERHTFDNVLVTGIFPCTTTPVNVTGLSATPASQQVALNWTNSTCYDEYLVVARSGSTVTAVPTGNGSAYTANTVFGNGTQIAANEFVVYKGTGISTTTTALTNGTTYHFKIFTRKGTNWSSGVAVSSTPSINYCAPTANPGIYGTSIRLVQFGNINNATPDRPDGGPGYQNYIAQSTNAARGSSIPLTVNVDTDDGPGTYSVVAYAWIDWNQNGNFNDDGGSYNLGTATGVDNGPTSNSPLSVTIPISATLGATRMRVLCQYYSGAIPTIDPCVLGPTDGEVEDYTVNIIPAITYTYNNGWSPSNPIGVSTTANNIIISNGTAVITANTQSNTIVVNPTGAITVNSGVTLSSANGLTMQSNATQYSSLLVNGSITGTVSYNRHVNGQTGVGVGSGGANDLIAAPVSGQSFSAFAAANANIRSNPSVPTQKLFGPFNKTTGTYQLWDTSANGAEILTAGVGYRAASTDNGGFVFTGTPNSGVVTHNIVNSGPQFAAYNLIGNPYPSYINVREFLEYDVEPGASVVRNIDLMDSYGAIYGYDGDASGVGGSGWVVYNLTTPATVNIAPGQGFLVTADAADVAAYDMTFTPSMRRIGNTDDFIPGRLADDSSSHIKLQAVMGTSTFKTDIHFNEASTSGLDFGYDAAVFGSNAASRALYSQLAQNNTGVDLAIQSLANDALGTDISIPIGINAPQGQQVTVSIAESDLPANIDVYLEDNVASTFTLLNTTDYVFTPSSNLTDTGRFFLSFVDRTLSTSDSNIHGLDIYSTSTPRALFIKGQLSTATTISLYDIQGRMVLSSVLDMASNSNQVDVSNLSSGVYVVKLNNNTQQKTQKVIFK